MQTTSPALEAPLAAALPEVSVTTRAQDDLEMVERVRAGDTGVFATLVRRHQRQVFAILSKYERDAHLVEDLAQETFLKAWRNLGQYVGEAPFEHWLSRITVNVALDHVRHQARRIKASGFDELGEDALDWLNTGQEDSAPDRRCAREILDLVFAEMSAGDRLVVTMQSIEGHSIEEICQRTGWSSASVRVRAHRARHRMRAILMRLMDREKHATRRARATRNEAHTALPLRPAPAIPLAA